MDEVVPFPSTHPPMDLSRLPVAISGHANMKDELKIIFHELQEVSVSLEKSESAQPSAQHVKRLSDLQEAFLATMEMEADLEHRKRVLELILQTKMNAPSNSVNLVELYGHELGKLKNNALPASDKFKDYKNAIRQIHHAVEVAEQEGLLVMRAPESASLTCPITMMELVEPYLNKPCGHVFSKDSIFELLHRKHTIKCPIAGCVHVVQKSSLERDVVTESKLRKKKASRVKDDDDDDEAEEIS